MKTLRLLITLILFLSGQQSLGANPNICDMSDYEKAIGAFLCQSYGFEDPNSPCHVKHGTAAGAAAVAGVGAAYLASFKMLEGAREYATLSAELKGAQGRQKGRGKFIQNGAQGVYTGGNTRSTDEGSYMRQVIQESAQDGIDDLDIIAKNSARLAELEAKHKLPPAEFKALVETFKSDGVLTKNSGGGFRFQKKPRNFGRQFRSVKALRKSIGIAGLALGGIAGGIATGLLVEGAFAYSDYRERERVDSCINNQYGKEISRHFEINTRGGKCELTGQVLPEIFELDDISDDGLRKRLSDTQYCTALKLAYETNKVNPPQLASFQCQGQSRGSQNGSFVVHTKQLNGDSLEYTPVKVSYYRGEVSGLETFKRGSLDSAGYPIKPVSFNPQGQATPRVDIDVAIILTNEGFSNARYRSVNHSAATPEKWKLVGAGNLGDHIEGQGRSLRDLVFMANGNRDTLQDITNYCLNGTASDGIAKIPKGGPDFSREARATTRQGATVTR